MSFNLTKRWSTGLSGSIKMNILFIEDERALAETAILQLEQRGHRVFPAHSVAEAREILDASNDIDCVIADHQLGDGFGIDFVIEAKAVNPNREYAIVSAYLNDKNIEQLENHSILYFRKPLLYRHVLDQIRKAKMNRRVPVKRAPNPQIDFTVDESSAANNSPGKDQARNSEQPKKPEPRDRKSSKVSILRRIHRKLRL